MKLSLETQIANIIHSYEPGEVKIRQPLAPDSETAGDAHLQENLTTLSGSLIITPETVIENWLENAPALLQSDMQRIIEMEPEVILLGTGEKLIFPDAALFQPCYQANIGVEVMNTSAACRTYNVLAAERRKVAVALMVV